MIGGIEKYPACGISVDRCTCDGGTVVDGVSECAECGHVMCERCFDIWVSGCIGQLERRGRRVEGEARINYEKRTITVEVSESHSRQGTRMKILSRIMTKYQ